MIVADTNLVAYLLIPGDRTEASEEVLRKDPKWCAPVLWRSELRNVLALYMRQQGMTLLQAILTMEKAEKLLGNHEYVIPSDSILGVVAGTSLSAYDAEFVSLAEHLEVKLVTADAKILAAAPKTALSPESFVRAKSTKRKALRRAP